MTIKEKKQKMLEWLDFYGGDIPQKDEINKATSDEELNQILNNYRSFLEDQHLDALSHIDNFQKELFYS